MQEKIIVHKKPPKSPFGAGVLSFFFPGTGTLYNGQYLKGLIFIFIFAGLVTMQAHGGQPFSALILGGFYIFQIIDAVQTARSINRRALQEEGAEKTVEEEFSEMAKSGSIFWGIALMAIGGILLLANFEVIDYDHIFDFWPIVVVVIGFKLIMDYFARKNR
ncbi:MAG: DUF5668 domain-containing protein [Candidatus Aminicenantales bacterium]